MNVQLLLCIYLYLVLFSLLMSKDITIQHLCTPESVELVEKCARLVAGNTLLKM